MSEKILETLMQLFAIIAKPQVNDAERRGVVEAFLKRLLNQELVKEYLTKYDAAYEEARKKLEKSSTERREGAIAIRIRKLVNRWFAVAQGGSAAEPGGDIFSAKGAFR